jgi:hypothetical protein
MVMRKATIAGGALGLLAASTATALGVRHLRRPTLLEQAAEIRKRYRREAAEYQSRPGPSSNSGLFPLQARANAELNELRLRYIVQQGGKGALSPAEKFRISVEFGLDRDETLPRIEEG